MTDPPQPAPGFWPEPADAPDVEARWEAVTLIAPDGAIVRGILWTPPSGRWRTAVALTHPPEDLTGHGAGSPLAAAGLAVLAFAPRDGDDDTGCLVDVETAVAHLRGLGADAVVVLGVPTLTPSPDPVLVPATRAPAENAGTRTNGDGERGGRRRVLAGATAVGLAVGVGLAVATGVPLWPVLGAVAGIGVGDLLAGGRR